MKTSTALNLAKKNLSKSFGDGNYRHICIAINGTYNNGRICTEKMYELKALITDRLAGSVTLEDWLTKHYGIKEVIESDYDDNPKFFNYYRKIQGARHAWIDSLIEEFKAKGD
jgi:hypothetical protein